MTKVNVLANTKTSRASGVRTKVYSESVSVPTIDPIPTHVQRQFQIPGISISKTSRFIYNLFNAPKLVDSKKQYSYSDFIHDVRNNKIKKVVIQQDERQLRAYSYAGEENNVKLLPFNNNMSDLLEHKVDVYVDSPSELKKQVIAFMPQILLYSIFIGLIIYNMNNMGANFTKKSSIIDVEQDIGVNFSDVAGAEIAKFELMEIVDFLQNGTKYTNVGARVPRGVLLSGPPGVGKTLLAKAVAGEAGVPFLYNSGSDFMELFVGVGAGRVRELFKKAREIGPAIIFIDEIDSIGKKRSSGMYGSGGTEERDQTLNQLLTLMDGFLPNEGVIVIAATNRPDILDDALLRPGRFDRQIRIGLPSMNGRADILRVHMRYMPIHDDVDIDALSKMSVGFSGADLANLCNEAAIYAAREDLDIVSNAMFEKAFEKITVGEERRSIVFTDAKKRVIAYHESGHALIGMLSSVSDTVRKVSIVPRGLAGGITYFEPLEDSIDIGLVTREYLETKIMVALGGRAAEELVFGASQLTNGASGDLKQVYGIAKQMITEYGFNEQLGASNWESVEGLGETEVIISKEVSLLVDKMYENTKIVIERNMDQLHALARELIEKETLTRKDLEAIVRYNNLEI